MYNHYTSNANQLAAKSFKHNLRNGPAFT